MNPMNSILSKFSYMLLCLTLIVLWLIFSMNLFYELKYFEYVKSTFYIISIPFYNLSILNILTLVISIGSIIIFFIIELFGVLISFVIIKFIFEKFNLPIID